MMELLVLGQDLRVMAQDRSYKTLKAGTEAIKYYAGRDRRGMYFECFVTGFYPFRVYHNSKHTHVSTERTPEEGLTILL